MAKPTPTEAAKKIVDGFHKTMELLPLAGGKPYPVETSTDHAVVTALAYQRLLKAAGAMAAALSGWTANELTHRIKELHGPAFDVASEDLWACLNENDPLPGEQEVKGGAG
jgi:hypothetical protein